MKTTPSKQTPKNATPTKRTSKKAIPTKRTSKKATPTISSLHSIIKLPQGWHDHTTPDFPSICLCKATDTAPSSAQPLVLTHSIIVQSDFTWKVFAHNHEVKKCSALCSIPLQLDETSVLKVADTSKFGPHIKFEIFTLGTSFIHS